MSCHAYLAVFKAGLALKGSPPAGAHEFHQVRASSDFPYDIGDDPSLYWAGTHPGSPITWGVCRPPVRRSIGRGDVVVFIAFCPPRANAPGEYRLVAALSVDSKIKATDVYKVPGCERYQDYPNLLIRPRDSGWEHYEPVLPIGNWHDDWLARVSQRAGRRLEELKRAGSQHVPGAELTANGVPVVLADSYVVFDTTELGFVATHPPCIATWQKGQKQETWGNDPRSQRIYELTLRLLAPTRTLRVANRVAHPHVVGLLDRNVRDWLQELRDACSSPRGTV